MPYRKILRMPNVQSLFMETPSRAPFKQTKLRSAKGCLLLEILQIQRVEKNFLIIGCFLHDDGATKFNYRQHFL